MSALDLLRTALARRGDKSSVSPVAAETCGIIDHFNDLHWHDRNRYAEEIKAMKDELRRLKEKVSRLERKGQDE